MNTLNDDNNTISDTISDNIDLCFKLFFYYASAKLMVYFVRKMSISYNNPMLIGFIDDEDKDELLEQKEFIKDEDKYLKKYKSFPNTFSFTEDEVNLENEKYFQLKSEAIIQKKTRINEIRSTITAITNIYAKGGIHSKDGINALLVFYEIEDEYDDSESVNLVEYLEQLSSDLTKYEQDLTIELESDILSDDELKASSREYIVNLKLDNFINNYVTEATPLGIVHMRYNNDKKSFEYFSNNTIPYRYLETIGRKYVTTFWCKPIFIDIEEELKKSEIKYDNDLKQKQIDEDIRKNAPKTHKKNVFANFKNYNKDGNKTKTPSMGGGRPTAHTLSSQFVDTLPKVNKVSEKQLLKETANRYTWEGRLHELNLLKKVVDKNHIMTFADFKKLN